MPPAAIPAIVSATGALGASAITAATANGGTSVSGFQLPPEFERQMLATFQQNITDAQASYKQYGMAADAYSQKLDIYKAQLSNLMPSAEAQKALSQNSMDLALGLGKSGKELVDNGFMTKADVDQLQAMSNINSGTYKNQATEDQLAGQRRQLDQDLARAGTSPAQRAMAIQQFNQSAAATRENANNNQFSRLQGVLQGGMAAREQGYNQTVGALNATNQGINMIWNGTNQMANIDRLQYGVAQDVQQAQKQQRDSAFGNYQELGKFILSDRTKGQLASGAIGLDGSGSGDRANGGPGMIGNRTFSQANPQYNSSLSRYSTLGDADLARIQQGQNSNQFTIAQNRNVNSNNYADTQALNDEIARRRQGY